MDELERAGKMWVIKNLLIMEAGVVKVSEGKQNARNEKHRLDCFMAMIKTIGVEFVADTDQLTETMDYSSRVRNFCEYWSFVREANWWLLDRVDVRSQIL